VSAVDDARLHFHLAVALATSPPLSTLLFPDAYDLQDSNGAVGDAFEAMIEPITATTPYMVRALREFSGAMPPRRANAAATSLSCHVPFFPPANDRDAQAITRRDFYLLAAQRRCPTPPPPRAPSLARPPMPLSAQGGQAFTHYTNRFSYMAGDNTSGLTPTGVNGLVGGLPNNHWYSFNIANVHIAVMSTEAYFFFNGAAAQFAWLEADLAAVDRSKTPWLVVFGHRSIYCSCDSDCDGAATTVREGAYGMEELFMKYGVDLFVNGHEHDCACSAPSRALAPSRPRSGGARRRRAGHLRLSPLPFLPPPQTSATAPRTSTRWRRRRRRARPAAPRPTRRSTSIQRRPCTLSRGARATRRTTSRLRARSPPTRPSAQTRTATRG
jgi:hypothetical protein